MTGVLTQTHPSASFAWRSAPMQKLYNWLIREDGQTMAEYGVVLAVITIAVFGALALLAGNITNALTRVAGYIT
jgi:Flp pilus assembly pilin Flp